MNEVQSFNAPAAQTAGLVGVQARELAELRNQYLIARDFPRDVAQAIEVIEDAFSDPDTAETAEYHYARGGNDISGPSIHAAQLIATSWGNIAFGWRELTRGTGDDGKRYSEVEAYAIDLQTRVPSRLQFIVPHWRDTQRGGYPLKDERDIYEACANAAQRRKRAAILSIVPARVVNAGMNRARSVMRAKADTSPEGIAKMLAAFKPFGVTQGQIEARIQRKIEAMSPDQWAALRKVWTSLNDGVGKVGDFFDPDPNAPEAGAPAAGAESAADKVKAKLRDRKGGAPAGAPGPQEAPPAGDAGAGATTAPAQGGDAYAGDPGAPEAPTAEHLREQLMQAKDKDAAMLVMDLARGLSKADYDSLSDLLDQRWPEA